MTTSRSALLQFALELAATAEAKILPHYRQHQVDYKPDGSEVTIADREAETAMRQQIAARFPDHAVLGEEFGAQAGASARYQWILDPVDGTVWFTLGLPIFGTLIGLLEDGEPILGVVHLPAMGETLYAARGEGCWFQVRGASASRVQVAQIDRLADAFVSASGVHSTDVYSKPGQTPYGLTHLIHRAKRFRFCGDCSQYVLLCRGKIHAAIDTIMNPWDIAAVIPCIEEAGGVVTSLTGTREQVTFSGSLAASCGEALHTEVIAALQPA